MKKTFFSLSILCILFLMLAQCTKPSVNDQRCDWLPNAGPCEAYIPKYYFDKSEKKCKEFIWGGCQGVVPYETLEECESKCDCH